MSQYIPPYYCKALPGDLSDQYYLNRVPDFVQALIAQIEDNCFFRIEISFDPSLKHARCFKERGRAEVQFPSLRYFNVGSLLHELLHMRLMYVQKLKPLIESDIYVGTQWARLVITYDNDIEHFIFVNEEISLWPSRKSYWCKKIHSVLNKGIEPGAHEDFVHDDVLKMHAFVKLILGSPKFLTNRLDSLIHLFSLGERMESFEADLSSSLSDKYLIASAFSKALSIPDNLFEIDDI